MALLQKLHLAAAQEDIRMQQSIKGRMVDLEEALATIPEMPKVLERLVKEIAVAQLVPVDISDSGSVGRFGYSFKGSVGSVNFALPAVTKTRVPSRTKVTGFAGRDLAISASNLPGTKTFPFVAISALRIAFVEVSKSEPVRVIESVTSIMIPRRAV